MKQIFLIFFSCYLFKANAQRGPDVVYAPTVKTVKLFPQSDQLSLPVLRLNSPDQIELHFDDLDKTIKSYYYTFQLCDANWQPSDLSPFDYINGYTQQRITQYRNSSIALINYVHYQLLFPEYNCRPTKSGNYLLKVYLNGDTSQLAFTKRFYVVDQKSIIAARITQPFNQDIYLSHQKMQLQLTLQKNDVFNVQQQVKITILQNDRYDNAIVNPQPTFIKGNTIEYNGEDDLVFEGGKEYHWADLRSFRFLSDRISKVNNQSEIILQADAARKSQQYLYWQDYNGMYFIASADNVNPWWQTDYGETVFTLIPPNHQPYSGKEVYLSGELVNNQLNENSKMEFNVEKGVYQKKLLLKQGYYNYNYVAKDNSENAKPETTVVDGSNWETENQYSVFVYYRSLSGRYDELVGVYYLNSRSNINF